MEVPIALIIIGFAFIVIAFLLRRISRQPAIIGAGAVMMLAGTVLVGAEVLKPIEERSTSRLLQAFVENEHADWMVGEELLDRINNAEMTDSEVAAFVEHLLELQSGGFDSWSGDYGDAIITAHDQGRVSDEQWRRFLRQGLRIFIDQPHQAPLDLPPILNLRIRQMGPQHANRFVFRCTHEETTIDGRPHWTGGMGGMCFMNWLTSHAMLHPMAIDLLMLRGRAPHTFEGLTFADQSEFAATEYGEYDLVSRWTLEVLDLGPDLPDILTQDAYVFATPETQWRMLLEVTGREPVKWTQTIEQPVEIKPLDEPETVSDDETRESIRGYLERGIRHELGGADESDPKLEMRPIREEFHPGDLPGLGVCDLYFDVFVVIDDTEHYLGPVHQHVTPAPHSPGLLHVRREIFIRGRLSGLRRAVRVPRTADVILRSNDIAPYVWTGEQPLFKGEFRFKDVPLRR